MRFMVIVKASKDTEAGVMPSTELLTAISSVSSGAPARGSGFTARPSPDDAITFVPPRATTRSA